MSQDEAPRVCPFAHGERRSAASKEPGSESVTTTSTLDLSRTASTDSNTGSSVIGAPRRQLHPVHYHSYLQLDTLLSAQKPKSQEISGVMAHDEMLFIIVHQAHELWFKQIAHDLDSVLKIMSADWIPEREFSRVVERLSRITKIQKLLIEHLTILETMTPLSFLDFREYLYPASGFQSMQFRTLEVKLGLRRGMRATYAGQGERYECALTPQQAQQILEMEKGSNLFDAVDKWLARLPVLHTKDFDFWQEYQKAVERMFAQDEADLRLQLERGIISETLVNSRISEINRQREFFKQFFDEEWYEHSRLSGARRLSYRACQAALMINFYQEEPLFQMPFQMLNLLLELDANFTAWRSKHAQMVHRMLGLKMGTGGSSGFSYLMQAVNDHKVFTEFYNLSSLLVPRAYLPPLPESVHRLTSFMYSPHHCDLNTMQFDENLAATSMESFPSIPSQSASE